jgi:hypothetical protein
MDGTTESVDAVRIKHELFVIAQSLPLKTQIIAIAACSSRVTIMPKALLSINVRFAASRQFALRLIVR